jgi:multidrug efflux pump subunit AcrA (membrane-fusion protein)
MANHLGLKQKKFSVVILHWLLLRRLLVCAALGFNFPFNSVAFASVQKKPVVNVRALELSEMADTLTYPARIEPRIRAAVLAEAEGVVSRIMAPLGSQVKAGAVVLVLRNTDPVYQYSPMQITSPVSGIVSSIEVTEGSRVNRGEKLALVTDPTQLRLVVEITAQDMAMMHAGLEGQMLVPGSKTGETINVRVKGVSPFVDPATGTASCELEFSAAHKTPHSLNLMAGSISRVSFRTNIRKGLSIAESAVTYRGSQAFVRVIENSKAKYVAVVLGRKQGDVVEIVSGLKRGDQVVERTSAYISDGEAVEIEASASRKL